MLRATIKSLLSRKLRLLLSGLAVVLGVMAVSGAFILSSTLSNSFDSLFKTVTKNLDVQVTGKTNVEISSDEGDSLPDPIPGSIADKLSEELSGAKKIDRVVAVDGARVVGKDGKVIPNTGPPRFGMNWTGEDDLTKLAEGKAPSKPNEVAINKGLAKKGDFKVGSRIKVLTLEPQKEFVVSGIFTFDGRSSLGGETSVRFTTPVAQKLMLGKEGIYSAVNIEAKDGVSQKELKSEVEKIVGSAYVVKTGEQVAKDQSDEVQSFLKIFRNILLGFAAVALFVGIFLILNTFSIIIAQRTKELALFRAMGASRRQVIGAVLFEAIVIGFIAATIGFFAGMGIAVLLKKLMQAQSGATLPGAALIIPPAAIIASYAVGILVTVLAAVIPAIRASHIPPVAAMREAEDRQKPMTKLTIAGSMVTTVGIVLMALALFGDASIWFLLLGVLGVFIGVAMLAPVVAQPVINVIGRVFSWSLPGKLGRRNSARNPRRTAITAAALMIGVSLVTGVSILASSLKSSVEKLVKNDFSAQLVIAGDFDGGIVPPSYDKKVITEIAKLPDVKHISGQWSDITAFDNGKSGSRTPFASAADWTVMKDIFSMEAKAGEIRTLKPGEVLLDDKFAKDNNLTVGSNMELGTQRGGDVELRVVGIYKESQFFSGPLLSIPDAEAGFRSPLPSVGFIEVKKGASVSKVQDQVDKLLADNPEVSVQNQQELIDQSSQQINQILVILYVLLGLAIIIAILGIINTLALSILERTRELGLLRAVGLTRVQTMRMVTVESVVISVFGALLGLALGSALGTAVVQALDDEGVDVLSFPIAQMAVFIIIAVIVGLFAAILPAIRAARTNVLTAISYE